MRRGVRLGVDVGRARVGLASSDRDGLMATPVRTLSREEADAGGVVAAIAEYEPIEIVVGLPLSLSGADTPSTADARDFASRLAALVEIPVVLLDERMSTVTAQRQLRESGRSSRRQRPVVDQVAATIILQSALDAERSSGREPGIRVPPGASETPKGTELG